MTDLLQEARASLQKPSKEEARKTLLIMNVVYIVSVAIFLSSEKMAEGVYVPITDLFWFAYLPALIINAFSIFYTPQY